MAHGPDSGLNGSLVCDGQMNPRRKYALECGLQTADCGLIPIIMEGLFAKYLTEEPNHGSFMYFIIRYRYISIDVQTITLTTDYSFSNSLYYKTSLV
jgi:hypothetical protein